MRSGWVGLIFTLALGISAQAQPNCLNLILDTAKWAPGAETILPTGLIAPFARQYSLPSHHLAHGALGNSEEFLDRWNGLQDYKAVHLYEQLLTKWALLLKQSHGAELADLFLITQANRRSHRYSLESRLFPALPSLEDFRNVLVQLRPPPGKSYDAKRIDSIEREMAELLTDGLRSMEEGLVGALPASELLHGRLADADCVETSTGYLDEETGATYLLNEAESASGKEHFLGMNLSGYSAFPRQQDHLILASLETSEWMPRGIFFSIPEEMARTMLVDIRITQEWLASHFPTESAE